MEERCFPEALRCYGTFIDIIVHGAWRKPSGSIGTSATLGLIGPEVNKSKLLAQPSQSGVTSESLSVHCRLVRLSSISNLFGDFDDLELLEGSTGKYVPVASLIALVITFSPDISQTQARV